MQTSKFLAGLVLFCLPALTHAQVRGNYDYRSTSNYFIDPSAHTSSVIPVSPAIANVEGVDYHTYRIKGLMNCEADRYMAIFTITQVGETMMEADSILRAKTNAIRDGLALLGQEVEMHLDMISFVPIYEIEVQKKVFSADTYNEVPKGFELKKNIHFRYKDPAVLDDLVTLCAGQEIYDLVRVDYAIDNLAERKAELVKKAESLLLSDISRHQRLLGEDFNDLQRQMAEGFRMTYPFEQYKTYTSFCNNSFNIDVEGGQVIRHEKTTSEFYMPMLPKGFDFVINPSILEPVVQIEYEIVMRFSPKPVEQQPRTIVETEVKKEVILVTPEGQLMPLDL